MGRRTPTSPRPTKPKARTLRVSSETESGALRFRLIYPQARPKTITDCPEATLRTNKSLRELARPAYFLAAVAAAAATANATKRDTRETVYSGAHTHTHTPLRIPPNS